MPLFLDDLIPKFDVMRAAMQYKRQPIKRCAYDSNGCAYFKTTGTPSLKMCWGDGHYRCQECVNFTPTKDER